MSRRLALDQDVVGAGDGIVLSAVHFEPGREMQLRRCPLFIMLEANGPEIGLPNATTTSHFAMELERSGAISMS
jgi:hypothetical protein